MARSHTYPVCKVGSDLLEFSNPIETSLQGDTAVRYLSKNLDMVSTESIFLDEINSFDFVLDSSKGEFLIDIPDITFEGGTSVSSPFLGIYFVNRFAFYNSGFAAFLRKQLQDVGYTEPSVGQIACVAIKRRDAIFVDSKSRFAAFNSPGEGVDSDSYGSNYLFNDFDFSYMPLKEGKWVTLMFTGTRWVAMGSNGWY